MRRILCLYLPNWPIQRVRAGRRVHAYDEMHQQAPPKGKEVHFAGLMHPAILHTRDPRRGLVVAACDEIATAAGARLGMPLAEALALCRHAGPDHRAGPEVKIERSSAASGPARRSGPVVLPHEPAADLAELARLAEHCERFSPLVGWETVEVKVQGSKFKVQSSEAEIRGQKSSTWNLEPGTWNSLFLDITGIGVLFGGEDALAREALADLTRLGYTARAAVAGTIGAAWGAAKFQVPGSRFQVIDSSTLNLELGTWNLASLRLPRETLDLLAQLGLTRIDELLALPRTSLRSRFGERLLLRLDQLTGAAQEVIVPYRPPPKFAAEWILEYPAERRDIVEQILRELVSRVAAALAERREGVVQLHCRLDCRGTDIQSVLDGMQFRQPTCGRLKTCPTRIDVGLFRPSADAQHLWDLVRMQLEQIALPGPVGRVTLQAVSTAPLENRQGELFAGGRHDVDRQLALLTDRLASRLGPENVLRPQLTADPLPEKAVKWVRAVQPDRSNVQRPKPKAARRWTSDVEPGTGWPQSPIRNPQSAVFRPLFLRPPLELDVVAVVPDGPPIAFRYAGRLYRVAIHWGPERIETGWYRGPSVRRDYYRVQTDEGRRFWLFRRLDDEKWCLHGEF
jgi:protein ImuB